MNYSVAICTYNGESYIAEQLESIISQTIPPTEIVLRDDRSSDHTLSIVHEIAENNPEITWKITLNDSNQGYLSNFQLAISECNQSIIFLSDQDDVWLKHKAETILKGFRDNEVLVMFSDAEIVDKELRSTGTTMFKRIGFTSKEQKEFIDKLFSADLLLRKHLVTGATMAIRKKIVPAVLPIPDNPVYIHDGWIATVGSIIGKVSFIPESLILYRQHSNNAIGASMKETATYPESKIDRLMQLISRHYNRELIIFEYLNNKKDLKVNKDKQVFLNDRISAYRLLLKKHSKWKKILLILQFRLLRNLPEFENPRIYFGNALIYLFNLK